MDLKDNNNYYLDINNNKYRININNIYVISKEIDINLSYDLNNDFYNNYEKLYNKHKLYIKKICEKHKREFSNIFNSFVILEKSSNKIDELNNSFLKGKDKHKFPLILKLNSQKIIKILKIIGYKSKYCTKFLNELIEELQVLINVKYKLNQNCLYDNNNKINKYNNIIFNKEAKSNVYLQKECEYSLIIKDTYFFQILKYFIFNIYNQAVNIKRIFYISYMILEKHISIILLFGGTSGAGKSTIAAVIGKLLNINNVISTDHIRHIVRNFTTKEEEPLIFSSTYNSWKELDSNQILDKTNNQKIIKGYKEQSRLITKKMENVIYNLNKSNESIIIEGVHINYELIKNITNKYNYVVPFVIYIKDANIHKERFANRSKNMSLNEENNKYISNFNSIRTIQKSILKAAELCLIPAIDNINMDKSINVIQQTLLKAVMTTMELNNGYKRYNYLNNIYKNIKEFTYSPKEADLLLRIKKYLNNKSLSNNKKPISLILNEIKQLNINSLDIYMGNIIKDKFNKRDIYYYSDVEDNRIKDNYCTINEPSEDIINYNNRIVKFFNKAITNLNIGIENIKYIDNSMKYNNKRSFSVNV